MATTKTLILRPISSIDGSSNATDSYLLINEEVADDNATVYTLSKDTTDETRNTFYFDNLNHFNVDNFSGIIILSIKLIIRMSGSTTSTSLVPQSNLFSDLNVKASVANTWETFELDCTYSDSILTSESIYIKFNTSAALTKSNTINITQAYLEISYEEIEGSVESINSLNITVNSVHKKPSSFYLTVNNVYKKVEKIFVTSNSVHNLCYGEVNTATKVPLDEDLILKLIDFNYTNNNDGTATIIGWKETYNGEPSTEMIIPYDERIIL